MLFASHVAFVPLLQTFFGDVVAGTPLHNQVIS